MKVAYTALLLSVLAGSAAAQVASRTAPELVISMLPGEDINTVLPAGAKITGSIPVANTYLVEFRSNVAASNTRMRLQTHPKVRFAENNELATAPEGGNCNVASQPSAQP